MDARLGEGFSATPSASDARRSPISSTFLSSRLPGSRTRSPLLYSPARLPELLLSDEVLHSMQARAPLFDLPQQQLGSRLRNGKVPALHWTDFSGFWKLRNRIRVAEGL